VPQPPPPPAAPQPPPPPPPAPQPPPPPPAAAAPPAVAATPPPPPPWGELSPGLPPATGRGTGPAARPPARPQPVTASPAPLLLDVTPLSLGVETVGGYCEHIIKRNAAIPVEQTRIFSTAKDLQDSVKVAICQGESRRLADNQALGQIELLGLLRAARGKVQIGVTFMIDASGTLGVRARDLATGREQTIRINLIGGAAEAEIDEMRRRHEALMAGR
jgi:molecular chaperone DnaK